jgi:hypothetical protein
MSEVDVQAVLQDEIDFLRILKVVARGFEAKTDLGKKIVVGWLGTFEKLTDENEKCISLEGVNAMSSSLKAETDQLVALKQAIIEGHQDEESWWSYFEEEIRFADALQQLALK